MSTHIRKAGIPGLRPAALAAALGMALMLWSAALAHADLAPTATTLQCTPESAKAGQGVRCTAFVKGVVAKKDAGQVLFKSEQGGQFSGSPCKLVFGEQGIASCSVEYTAPEGVRSDRIHAIFSGNEASASSEGTFTVTILGGDKEEGGDEEGGEKIPPAPNPTATALTCTPESAKAGQPVHCTVTVKGVVGSSGGRVVFKSESGGSFSAGSCELRFADGLGSCGVDYTSTVSAADATVADRLHAIFVGDSANLASEGIFTLAIVGKGGGGKEEGGKNRGGKQAKAAAARRKRAAARHRHHHRSRHRAGAR